MSKKTIVILTVLVLPKRKLSLVMCDCKAKHPHAYLKLNGISTFPIPFFSRMQIVDFLMMALNLGMITDDELLQLMGDTALLWNLPFRL